MCSLRVYSVLKTGFSCYHRQYIFLFIVSLFHQFQLRCGFIDAFHIETNKNKKKCSDFQTNKSSDLFSLEENFKNRCVVPFKFKKKFKKSLFCFFFLFSLNVEIELNKSGVSMFVYGTEIKSLRSSMLISN